MSKKDILLNSISWFIHEQIKIFLQDVIVKVVVEIYSLEDIEAARLDLYSLSQTLFGNPKRPVELGNQNTCAETSCV